MRRLRITLLFLLVAAFAAVSSAAASNRLKREVIFTGDDPEEDDDVDGDANNQLDTVLVSELLGLNTTGVEPCESLGGSCSVGKKVKVNGKCVYVTECPAMMKRLRKSNILKTKVLLRLTLI